MKAIYQILKTTNPPAKIVDGFLLSQTINFSFELVESDCGADVKIKSTIKIPIENFESYSQFDCQSVFIIEGETIKEISEINRYLMAEIVFEQLSLHSNIVFEAVKFVVNLPLFSEIYTRLDYLPS